MKKRLVAIVLTMATVMALFVAPAFAKVTYEYYDKPIKCYSWESKTTIVYNGASEGSGVKGKIWAGDEILIYRESSNGWSYVKYPKDSGGYKEGWIKATDVVAASNCSDVLSASRRIETYNRSNGWHYGHISKGDYVVYFNTINKNNNNRVQVVYELDSGGYKIAWINASDMKYLKRC